MRSTVASAVSHPRVPRRVANLGLDRRWGGYMGAISPNYKEIDPFIFLAYHEHNFRPRERSGFPPHPHRGFETVTYCIEGGFEHGDSMGNKGRYGEGDVQWMRAGKGVLHAEMFLTDKEKDNHFLGFQLWLNLPQRLKMAEPAYQMLWKKDIPVVDEDGVKVRIIAGEYGNKRADVQTNTPLSYFHVTLSAGKTFSTVVPKSHNAFLFNFKGDPLTVVSDGSKIPAMNYGIFAPDALKEWDSIAVRNEGNGTSDLLILHGHPFNEPMLHRMELMQAFQDYSNGLFGTVPGFEGEEDDDE